MNILKVPISQKRAFKAMLGISSTVPSVVLPRSADASTEMHPAHPIAPPDAVAMLYDSTICTGCKACTPVCNEANDLPADTLLSGGIWDMPTGLNKNHERAAHQILLMLPSTHLTSPTGCKGDPLLTVAIGSAFEFWRFVGITLCSFVLLNASPKLTPDGVRSTLVGHHFLTGTLILSADVL
jgi:ferredoxin